MFKKIFISNSSFCKCSSKPLKLLENEGYNIITNPFGRKMTHDEIPYSGPLKKLDNVVITHHIGSYVKESRIDMEIQSVKNLLGVLNEEY